MKKQLKTTAIQTAIFAAVIAFAGCTATKIEYEKKADGVAKYSIWHNDHWLKRDTGAMSGGMDEDGRFEVKLESATASPSEEFNRTMQTYTSAFVQLAQIAAAAYNPSSSGIAAPKAAERVQTVVNVQPESATAAPEDPSASAPLREQSTTADDQSETCESCIDTAK